MIAANALHKLKNRYTDWNHGDGLVLIEAWARDGLTNEQIANNIGIAEGTLYRWQKDYSEIREALKRGKAVVDVEVENSLHKKALGYNVELKKTFKVKVPVYKEDGITLLGWGEELQTGIDEVHVPADTTAQIFWLKNRKPEQWRDRPVLDDRQVLEKLDDMISAIDKQAK